MSIRACTIALLSLALLLPGCGNNQTVQTVNTPPSATITLPPPESAPYVELENITFEGSAIDQGGSAEDLQITWMSNHDGVINTDPPDSDGLLTFVINDLSINTHVITLEVVDSGGKSDEDEVTVVVLQSSEVDEDGDGYTPNEGDCEDDNPLVYPGATEDPNGVDDDCDGLIDEGTHLYDDDGDGLTETDGDCDDYDADTYPDAPELADEVDNDCDGTIDEGTVLFDDDNDGYTENDGDCDDADPAVFPTATEAPDGLDNDCNSLVDDGTTAADDDGDGYCEGYDLDGDGVDDCSDGALPGDCDDTDAAVNPAATEVCGDYVDNDCSGVADDEGALGCDDYYEDLDGDNYGTASACLCGPSGDYTGAYGSDCDDQDANVHPGQSNWFSTSSVNGSFDYDCNGVEEQQYPNTVIYDCDCLGVCVACSVSQHGYSGSVPACGASGSWVTDCWVGDFPWTSCDLGSSAQTQTCR